MSAFHRPLAPFARSVRRAAPALLILSLATAAHAQGSMDFSGATSLMNTFKTFAMYAGAVMCLGGLIFAGIRLMGGRFQFTVSHKDLGVANRDLGTVTGIEPNRIAVRMDGEDGRVVTFDPRAMRHFDHGYAVTSHSAQGLTTGRVLVNMDGETARSLVNSRLAYVAISRASDDARIYTNDAATIGQRLATEVTKTAAVDFRPPAYTPAEIERHHAPIRKALDPQDAAQFRWKGETGTVQTYRHTETGRNIHIDGKGQFYSQEGKPTSQEAALERALPTGRAHSLHESENSIRLGR